MKVQHQSVILLLSSIMFDFIESKNITKEVKKRKINKHDKDLTSDEKFKQKQLELEEKIKLHQEKIKDIQEKLKEKEEKRRKLLIKKGKLTTKFWLDEINDPDYFIRTPPPTSQELRDLEKKQEERNKFKEVFYNDDVKYPTYPDTEINGTMPVEHFSWPDESKDIDFFEKVYGEKSTLFPTTIDTRMDHLIHPFDNPDHPHYQNEDIAYKQYYKYNSHEINYYNKQFNLTLKKEMFTPPAPYVTGTNLSDWYNDRNNSDRGKVFHFPIDYNKLTAKYMKYVFTPLSTLYPGHDDLLERIEKNYDLPRYEDHIKNSTWCFICGETFSHPRDRAPHVTNKHYAYGDYGQDRLSDPNWEWKENIDIYRRPTFLQDSYHSYVDQDHRTQDISFDHYEYWDLKRKAGEITFPNRPETLNRTRPPMNRKRYQEIAESLKHFIWMPPKEDQNKNSTK